METNLTTFPLDMEGLRKFVDREGKQIEFWSARDLQPKFGYDKWDNFALVIEKAKENCSKVGEDPKNHFAEVRKMVGIGSGAYREQIDVVLSRTACYLIALNGDASKVEISWAKAYFIVQTKLQEKRGELLSATEERLRLREKLKEANRQLGGGGKISGGAEFRILS